MGLIEYQIQSKVRVINRVLNSIPDGERPIVGHQPNLAVRLDPLVIRIVPTHEEACPAELLSVQEVNLPRLKGLSLKVILDRHQIRD
jgi:hypothetical protein